MLTTQEKECVQYILSLTFPDLKFLNLEFIYSQVEELIYSEQFPQYIQALKLKSTSEEKDDFEDCLLQTFMCHLFIQKDLSEHTQCILEEIREWLLNSYIEEEEDTGEIVDKYYRKN
jgi:hypothetical protein